MCCLSFTDTEAHVHHFWRFLCTLPFPSGYWRCWTQPALAWVLCVLNRRQSLWFWDPTEPFHTFESPWPVCPLHFIGHTVLLIPLPTSCLSGLWGTCHTHSSHSFQPFSLLFFLFAFNVLFVWAFLLLLFGVSIHLKLFSHVIDCITFQVSLKGILQTALFSFWIVAHILPGS